MDGLTVLLVIALLFVGPLALFWINERVTGGVDEMEDRRLRLAHEDDEDDD